MISVIIPVYNAEEWVGSCLASVLAQTFGDFEVIIIDDGSTDDGYKICHAYENSDQRFHTFHQSNKGVGAARNWGMERSHGELIFFLDADDYLEPNALEVLYQGWLDSKAPMIIGGIYKVTSKGVKLPKPLYFTGILDKKWIDNCVWSYLQDHNNYLVSHCWGRLYERYFLRDHGIRFREGVKVGEDGTFNIDCLAMADSIMVINEPLYCFQMHNDSSSMLAINNNQLDLGSLQYSLNFYFTKRVESFIRDLAKVTKEWGKKNG